MLISVTMKQTWRVGYQKRKNFSPTSNLCDLIFDIYNVQYAQKIIFQRARCYKISVQNLDFKHLFLWMVEIEKSRTMEISVDFFSSKFCLKG